MGTRIKQLLAEDKVVKVCGIGQLCHPKIVEMIGLRGGYDAVWLDHEHVGLTNPQMEEAARACRASSMDSFTRLYPTDYAAVMRPLEAGVGGVMAAQIRTVKETRNVVKWAKFHPLGQRGVNGTGVDGRFGTVALADYFAQANDETFVAIQIENDEGLSNVDAIASVPGVDVLFIGPADLSQSLGIPGQWDHPDLWQAIEKIASAAKSNQIHWAILPLNPDFGKRCVEQGCRMLSIGMDVWIMQKGLQANLDAYGFLQQ